MRFLNKNKLLSILDQKNLSLNQLAFQSGTSRQSLYNMFAGDSIYNSPFEKILNYLKVDPETITDRNSLAENILKQAPFLIQKTVLKLEKFCINHNASLILFGSQVSKPRPGSDWDFGIYFLEKRCDREFILFKENLKENAFPYRVDVVSLNLAPTWFLESIRHEHFVLTGQCPKVLKK